MQLAIDARSLMDGLYSGVETYTVNIIRAMVRVAPHHTYHLFYNSARPVQLPEFGASVKVHAFGYPNKLFNLAQWSIAWPRWSDMVAADCFFVPSLRLVPLASTVPLVTTVHDLSFEHFPHFFSWRRRLWHRMMRPRELLLGSNHLIAVSHSTAHDIVALYDVPPERISVISSGVAVPRELPDQTERQVVRSRYQLPEQFILFVGTLEPRKNVPSIIRAFAAIADTVPHHLVIAGPRGWLTGEIDRAIATNPHRARIHRTGFVREADKMSLYMLADLFVYPSFYEGFGFPPLEALLAGTPVITSANSSLPEVVGSWATLVDPYDRGELALCMQSLLRDRPRVESAVQALIRQRYNWDTAARHTLHVIEQTVASADKPSKLG